MRAICADCLLFKYASLDTLAGTFWYTWTRPKLIIQRSLSEPLSFAGFGITMASEWVSQGQTLMFCHELVALPERHKE
jgi:hypothetical protein